MLTIYSELFAASKQPQQRPGESENDFITRMLRAISSINDDEWNSLSQQAQFWYDGAIKEVNKLRPAPHCPGYLPLAYQPVQTPREITPLTGSIVAEQTKSLKMGIIPDKPESTSDKPAELNYTPLAQPLKPYDPTLIAKNVTDAIKATIILHQDWTTRRIYQYLKDNGWPNVNLNTVAIDASNVRRIIAIARHLGYWKEPNAENDNSAAGDGNEVDATVPAASD